MSFLLAHGPTDEHGVYKTLTFIRTCKEGKSEWEKQHTLPNFESFFFRYDLIAILRISLIETDSGKESQGDINISVVVIGNVCYGD